jgi:hypothetical protein
MQSSLILRNLDVDQTGDIGIAVPCALTGYYISNQNAAVIYVKFYDQVAAADENDTPVLTLAIPTASAANMPLDSPAVFFNGLALRATTGVADNDTGAPDANDVVANIYYNEIA